MRVTPSQVWRWGAQAISLAACVLVWHVLSTQQAHLGLVTFANVPPPAEVWDAAWELVGSPKLSQHLSSSLLRVASGFVSASVLGVGLGLLIGRSRWARLALLPPLEVARPIPAVAWIPLAILMIPSSEEIGRAHV